MSGKTNWKLFFILLLASTVTVIMVLPYILALSPQLARLFTPAVYAAQIIQSLIIFAIAIFFGLKLAKRVGFGLPVLEGDKPVSYLKSILRLSVGIGILAGVLIILFSLLFPSLTVSLLKAEAAVALWKRLFASFYGGVAEEIIMRLFVMTLLVWISWKINKTPAGKPTAVGIWTANILSSIVFGLGHLGITGSMTAITWIAISRAVLLNGVAGIMFGWLYWKKGLESAMIAHFSADIVIHVITPFIASFFLV